MNLIGNKRATLSRYSKLCLYSEISIKGNVSNLIIVALTYGLWNDGDVFLLWPYIIPRLLKKYITFGKTGILQLITETYSI